MNIIKFVLSLITLISLSAMARDKMKGTTGNPHGDAHLSTNLVVQGDRPARFVSGIVGDQFLFSFNNEGVQEFSKLGLFPDFEVSIEKAFIKNLIEVSGELALPYKDGEANEMRSRPGNTAVINVTLTREFDGKERKFRDDRQKVLNGEVVRRSITIHFKNDAGERSQIHVFGCWPKAYSITGFDSKSSNHALERAEYQCEEWKIKND